MHREQSAGVVGLKDTRHRLRVDLTRLPCTKDHTAYNWSYVCIGRIHELDKAFFAQHLIRVDHQEPIVFGCIQECCGHLIS